MEHIAKNLRNKSPEDRIDKIKEFLKSHGIRVSHQRLLILDYLITNPIHPTADKIYRDLKQVDPIISQATVYNTLNLFVKHKLVKELDFNLEAKRYEFSKENHGHFICESCGLIEDIEVDDVDIPKDLKDYEIDTIEVIYRGICKSCKKNH